MLERKLFETLDKNPTLIREFNRQNGSHPLIREYRDIDPVDFH